MTYETILARTQHGVRRLMLNRGAFSNAQNRQLLAELDDAMIQAERDRDIRVVILGAQGNHFSAGHDLKEAQRDRRDLSVEQRWDWEEEFYLGHCLRIWDLKKPTIAEVQGACISAGFMVANMCDLIVASDDAYFADPVAHSLGAAAVELLVHPWALGTRKAKEMLYTGGRISASDALTAGMVNRVVQRCDLNAATDALAAQIAAAPPFGIRLLKRSINRTLDIQGFRNSIQSHFDTHELSHESAEFKHNARQGLSGAIAAGRAASAVSS